MESPPLVKRNFYFVWKEYQRRAEVLAPLFGANVVFIRHQFRRRALRPIDYVIKLWRTLITLIKFRNGLVITQSPPVFAALPARILGFRYIIDAHNATFQTFWGRFPTSQWLINDAAAVIVHNDEIAVLAKQLFPKARFYTIPDPIPSIECDCSERVPNQVLVIGSFGNDEPVDILLEVIAKSPDTSFVITANLTHLPQPQQNRLRTQPNVVLTGFLPVSDYHRLLCRSAAAIVLTTRQATQPSGACEALASNTPLILSRTSLTRELFGEWAVLVENSVESITSAIRSSNLTPRDLSNFRNHWNLNVESSVADLRRNLGYQPPRLSERDW